MKIFYESDLDDVSIETNLKRLLNQVYKLLPLREENSDWHKPLETIIEEFAGMNIVLIGKHEILFQLLCKLQGLLEEDAEDNFSLYRRVIFDCLNLIGQLIKICQA